MGGELAERGGEIGGDGGGLGHCGGGLTLSLGVAQREFSEEMSHF